jgi:CRISPR-associated endonuclease/helicase Cas3
MPEDFPSFFRAATGKPAPYDYQERLAEEPCISRLISIPTGLGKTAA